jgi:hypothetical protein
MGISYEAVKESFVVAMDLHVEAKGPLIPQSGAASRPSCPEASRTIEHCHRSQ